MSLKVFEWEHSEYLGDVNSYNAYTSSISVGPLTINPGNSTTFPFLSNLAVNFLHYVFDYLYFEFRSTSAAALNSTNTALGNVIARAEYDPMQPLDTTLYQTLNSHGRRQSAPCTSWVYHVIVPPHTKIVTNANATIATTGNIYNLQTSSACDPRQYHIGWFNVWSQGSQATANIGQLHVHYKVRLMRPLMIAQPGYALLTYSSRPDTVTDTNVLGTNATVLRTNASNTLPLTIGLGAARTITFPRNILTGYFFFQYAVAGNSTVVSGFTVTATTACTIQSLWMTTLTILQIPINGSTSTRLQTSWIVKVENVDGTTPAVITLSAATLPASVTNAELNCFQINPESYGLV